MKQLRISGKDYAMLKDHLYPGDGYEAIAFALCGNFNTNSFDGLMVHEVYCLPHDLCKIREYGYINWPPEFLEPILLKADEKGLSILKIHSHPSGYSRFSEIDTECDLKLFRSVFGWVQESKYHASAVMLPDGQVFGRFIDDELNFITIDKVLVAGDSIRLWSYGNDYELKDQDIRNRQAFGERTVQLLKSMKVGVIGCSGTGSIVIEQLVRLGVGKIVMVDPQAVEKVNLNRILNTFEEDTINKRKKVDVLKERLSGVGFGTEFIVLYDNICESRSALKELATCDVCFGGLDAQEPRYVLNQLSTHYIVPYFDIGVELRADGNNGISKVYGAIHYVQPKGSSLGSREAISMEKVSDESMKRKNPEMYEQQVKEKYIKGAGQIDSPAVISVNMQLSAMTVNEFLNKVDSFKSCNDDENAIVRVSISDNLFSFESDGDSDTYLAKFTGLGDREPFIGIIGL